MNWIFKILGIRITRLGFKKRAGEEERVAGRGRGRGRGATVRGREGHRLSGGKAGAAQSRAVVVSTELLPVCAELYRSLTTGRRRERERSVSYLNVNVEVSGY